ncbi:hypothetical protein DASB73_004100 [Starmerella bacillaris]|uniref:DNA replication factor Cdt1 C-terminal domain-containing protein n=1 Tax=Starmerella bacillaris TaxID=1247836 RepID=A0AAV5REB9_STABA|nr:hypothetical protein DASB73_004100 [Starmerella bacillaris]
MNKFLAIENILHFHHTTTRQPLNVSTLCSRTFRNGTAITVKDIEQILQVWPEAYKMYMIGNSRVIEAEDLPVNVKIRREIYQKKFNEKENTVYQRPVTMHKSKCTTGRVTKRPILMGRMAWQFNEVNKNTEKKGTLLERIRAKEASLKYVDKSMTKQQVQDTFLKSQIPKIQRVLNELTMKSTSIELPKIMDIIRTNLFKLSDEEIYRSLQLLEQANPSLCKVVTVGNETHVKLVSA